MPCVKYSGERTLIRSASDGSIVECGQRLHGRALGLVRPHARGWKGLPVESPVRRCSRLRRSLCSLAHSCAATADSTVALRTIWPSWRTETRLRAPVISSSHSKPDTRHRRITEVPIAPPEVRSRQNPTPLRSFGLSVNVLPSPSSGAAHTTPRRTALFATTGGPDPCVSCHRDHLGDDPRSAAPQRGGRPLRPSFHHSEFGVRRELLLLHRSRKGSSINTL